MVGKTSLAVAAASDAIAGWTRQAEAKPTLFYDRDTASEIWSRASSGGGFSEVTRLFRWYATYGSRTCGIKRYRSAWLDGCMFGIDEVWMPCAHRRPQATDGGVPIVLAGYPRLTSLLESSHMSRGSRLRRSVTSVSRAPQIAISEDAAGLHLKSSLEPGA